MHEFMEGCLVECLGCTELVTEGQLPPVAERVGPEPAVAEGVEGVQKVDREGLGSPDYTV